jgi:AraC-like DNA-binding protein
MAKNAINENKTIKGKYAQGVGGRVLDASYFYYETAPNYNKQLVIVCGGYEKCAPDFEINRSNYPYYFIKYTVKGRGALAIKNRNYELNAGVITGFGPGTSHHYIADPQNPMEHIFVTFLGTEAEYLLKTASLADKGIIMSANSSEISEIMEKIFKVGSEKKQHSQSICCDYLRILSLSLGQNTRHLETGYSRSMTTCLECKKYIDDNFSKISSPQEVAEYCGINPRYMSSLFKRYSLNSPYEYIMGLKLNKAANLLLTSMFSVKEVAYKTGFDDPYHFSRNFKKFHNLSPRDYRDKHT